MRNSVPKHTRKNQAKKTTHIYFERSDSVFPLLALLQNRKRPAKPSSGPHAPGADDEPTYSQIPIAPSTDNPSFDSSKRDPSLTAEACSPSVATRLVITTSYHPSSPASVQRQERDSQTYPCTIDARTRVVTPRDRTDSRRCRRASYPMSP